MVSASRHAGVTPSREVANDCLSHCSIGWSRSSERFTDILSTGTIESRFLARDGRVQQALQIQRTRVVDHRCKTLRDLGIGQPPILQLTLHILSERLSGPRQLAG